MRRGLFIICSGLSLLMIVVIIAHWIWAYSTRYQIRHQWTAQPDPKGAGTAKSYSFNINHWAGRTDITLVTISQIRQPWWFENGRLADRDVSPAAVRFGANEAKKVKWEFVGFGYADFNPAPAPCWTFRIPDYALVFLLAILPTLWVMGWVRRQRRRRAMRCVGCGYDLRASEDRCPECGVVIAERGEVVERNSN